LFLAGVENGRTIAPPSIVALAIQRGRVVDLEKEFQKLAIAELSRIKIDLDRFGMRSVIGVRCVWDGAACVAHPRSYHTRVSARQLLHTPEAAASKNGSLSGHLTFFEQLTLAAVSFAFEPVNRNEGIVAKSGSGSDRVRRARHRDESFQMASLSWRYHSLVRAVVPEVSDLICAYGRDGAGTWSAHPPQLHLALGPNLRAGTGEALPPSPETDQ
jgi:hypothetical protein